MKNVEEIISELEIEKSMLELFLSDNLEKEELENTLNINNINYVKAELLFQYINQKLEGIKKQDLIDKLQGENIRVNAKWLKENDEELLEFITEHKYWGRGFDFRPSKDNCILELYFNEGGIGYIATSTEIDNWRQALNNQPYWFEDSYENCDIKDLQKFYNKMKGVK